MVACGAPVVEAERAAGVEYAKAADAADRQVQANDGQLDTTLGSEQDFRDYYRRWADIERAFVTAVSAIDVPPAHAADLASVIAAYGRVEATLRRFETEPASNWDRVKLELNDEISAAIRAANVLRPKLGLPTAEEAAPS